MTEQQDFVTFNDNCTVHILKMCNGLMHCDDCADEDFDDCMAQQCSESIAFHEIVFPCIFFKTEETPGM